MITWLAHERQMSKNIPPPLLKNHHVPNISIKQKKKKGKPILAQKLSSVLPSKSLQINSVLNISITTKSPKLYDQFKYPNKQKASKFQI